MTCASPRLDPTLAYPVPLRPSVFQHARFIDKMQPGMTKVKQEKYEIFQDEPLKDGKYTRRVKFRLQLLFCFKQLVFSTKKRKTKMLGYRGRQMPNLERKNLSQTDCQLLYSFKGVLLCPLKTN